MASKSGSGKKSGSTRSGDAGSKDRLIAELKERVAVVENELRLKQSDITSREVIDRKLMGEYLGLFQRMVDKAADMVFLLGPMGRIQYVNEAACKVLGYTREELLSMTVFNLNLKHHVDNWQEHEEELKKQGSITFENVFKTKDNRLIPVEISANYARLGDKEYNYSFIRDITERKRTEESLRESDAHRKVAEAVESERNRLFDLLETLPAMICLLTPDYHIAFANRSYRERFGESHGRHCYEYCFGRTEPCEFCEAYNVLKTGRPHYWEVRGPDDSLIEVYNSPFTDVDGSPMILKMGVDVTERKRAEEALRESEEKFRLLAETSPAAIFIYQDNKYVYVNPATESISGYSRDELMEMSPLAVVHPAYREKVENLASQRKQGIRFPSRYEMKILTKDGRERWMDSSSAMTMYKNRPAGLAVAFDITDRKRVEEALQKSEASLARAQFLAHIGNWSWDLGTNELEYSDECYRLLGYEPGEIRPVSFDFFISHIHRDDKEPFFHAIRESIQGVKPFSIDFRLVKPDGSIVYMHDDGEVLYDVEGNPVKMFGTVQDITERKRAEKELVNAKAQAELYLDLMGHDINNLHQVALGYLELARDMPAGENQAVFLEKPIEVLQRSAKLISNVRKLQKLRDGMFQDQDVDVCKVLSDVQREYGAVPSKTITLSLNGFEHCHVRANELLHDVFSNLVGNAVKHTGERAAIVVDLDVVEYNGGRYCRVMVEDDGPGIPDNFKSVIFNRALKGTANAKGIGLGLYLVKSLVESYSGRVWIEDHVPGDHTKGARFVVMLPAIEK